MSEQPHTADLATRYRYREEGRELERERITTWVEANRTAIVIDKEEDLIMYRDRFTSESLLAFINGEGSEDE